MRFTRHGFWELLIGTVVLVGLAWGLGLAVAWWLALVLVPVLVWLFAFFRDPERTLPQDAVGGSVTFVSPADGRVSDVTRLDICPVLGEPAVRVGIFLSVFDVHVNRSPCDGVVRSVQYKKGRFLNALDHANASEHNESNTVVLEDDDGRAVAVVKQIVGLIARRIVSTKQVGQRVARGERIGMIKFGSRTELTIPLRLSPDVRVREGQKVKGGSDVIAAVTPEPAQAAHDPELRPLVPATPV